MTTNLLIFFAIPLTIIVFSIALQKILKNPFLVASIIFSILLLIVLSFFDPIYLIAVVVYTILSFVTAIIKSMICRYISNNNQSENNEDNCMYSNDKEVEDSAFIGKTGYYSQRCNRRKY